jgi:hypothetical protein
VGWLNSEKPPAKWDAGYFKLFVEKMRTAVNYIDANNFKEGIFGAWIKDKSITMGKLIGGMFEIGLISLATAFTSTSTTVVNASGLSHWESNTFPSTARCYLEVTGTSSNSAATATFELHGASGILATVTTSSGAFEWLRSVSFEPPTVSQTLVLKVKTSNASYMVGVLNAKVVIIL